MSCAIIYIYSERCGFCQQFKPVFEEFMGLCNAKLPNVMIIKSEPRKGIADAAFLQDIGFTGGVPYIAFVRFNTAGKVVQSRSYRGPRTAWDLLQFTQFHCLAA